MSARKNIDGVSYLGKLKSTTKTAIAHTIAGITAAALIVGLIFTSCSGKNKDIDANLSKPDDNNSPVVSDTLPKDFVSSSSDIVDILSKAPVSSQKPAGNQSEATSSEGKVDIEQVGGGSSSQTPSNPPTSSQTQSQAPVSSQNPPVSQGQPNMPEDKNETENLGGVNIGQEDPFVTGGYIINADGHENTSAQAPTLEE